jgi:hypothetical protein
LFFFTISLVLSQVESQLDSALHSISSSGISYYELPAYKKTILGDGKLSIMKLNPECFDFQLICASQSKISKSAPEWVDTLALNIIFNAGMYNVRNEISHQYYMKNFEHVNNPNLSSNVNGIIAFNPENETLPKFQIFDLTIDDWSSITNEYQTLIQGQRMIDCNGNPVFWNNRVQYCSMILLAQDKENNLYIIFSRSPFTQNQMIENLLELPFELINAIYLEGGSRANFVVSTKDLNIQKVGSYVSNYNPNDDNQSYFSFPNFIGMKQVRF